jgi:F0F1-type ATP synthase membrane subunit c/vacuolar-type H+-ATPase subunit K
MVAAVMMATITMAATMRQNDKTMTMTMTIMMVMTETLMI